MAQHIQENLLSVTWPFSTFQVWARVQGFPSPTLLLTLPQKPAAYSWDEKLDMIQEAGVETLRRIEAKLKVPGKIAGRLKKKIASELAEFRKAFCSRARTRQGGHTKYVHLKGFW